MQRMRQPTGRWRQPCLRNEDEEAPARRTVEQLPNSRAAVHVSTDLTLEVNICIIAAGSDERLRGMQRLARLQRDDGSRSDCSAQYAARHHIAHLTKTRQMICMRCEAHLLTLETLACAHDAAWRGRLRQLQGLVKWICEHHFDQLTFITPGALGRPC